MKKILVFGAIVVFIFVLLGVVTNMQNKQVVKDNPYHKETLHPETIKQLDDPIYKNIIVPEELQRMLENKESAFVYFYSPTCSHCKVTSPIVVPMAEQLGIDLFLFNLLEFEEGWDDYQINGTPTIVHYVDGMEVSRIEGGVEADLFEKWFRDNIN